VYLAQRVRGAASSAVAPLGRPTLPEAHRALETHRLLQHARDATVRLWHPAASAAELILPGVALSSPASQEGTTKW